MGKRQEIELLQQLLDALYEELRQAKHEMNTVEGFGAVPHAGSVIAVGCVIKAVKKVIENAD
ncbi:hypothetical protein [Mesorhizobium sp. M8A.F.Ca.ET.165.01.1.1]|uniref:hypothetical protein n=1 Tax=Mesorhizobium sp. M8A.F.Ca.ET.165.01.1.1 TaxID=2563960 RepID=UPI001093CF75|nr:hypothetical protein [Mesorhizobium sp. M8A.F.Ca.ET.165.01.1.1]TGT42754.1 hypothetical protein EN808_12795 [Mesorhizobium sp. M8A.F.Ca.ET.165.01.1.1]